MPCIGPKMLCMGPKMAKMPCMALKNQHRTQDALHRDQDMLVGFGMPSESSNILSVDLIIFQMGFAIALTAPQWPTKCLKMPQSNPQDAPGNHLMPQTGLLMPQAGFFMLRRTFQCPKQAP